MSQSDRARLTVGRPRRGHYPLTLALSGERLITGFLPMARADDLLSLSQRDLDAAARDLRDEVLLGLLRDASEHLSGTSVPLEFRITVPRLAALPWERAVTRDAAFPFSAAGRHLDIPAWLPPLLDLPLRVATLGDFSPPAELLAGASDVIVWQSALSEEHPVHVVHLAGTIVRSIGGNELRFLKDGEEVTWSPATVSDLARELRIRLLVLCVADDLPAAWEWSHRVAASAHIPILVHTSDVDVVALYRDLLAGTPLDQLSTRLTLYVPDALVPFLPWDATTALRPTDMQAGVEVRVREVLKALGERLNQVQKAWEESGGEVSPEDVSHLARLRRQVQSAERLRAKLGSPLGVVALNEVAKEVLSLCIDAGVCRPTQDNVWDYFASVAPGPEKSARRAEEEEAKSPRDRGWPGRDEEIAEEVEEEPDRASSRHVNTAFLPHDASRPLGIGQTLEAGARYYLRLDIGPASPESNARVPIPLREERLPTPPPGGLPLDIVVFAGDFVLAGEQRTLQARLQLPPAGPARVVQRVARPESMPPEVLNRYLFIPVQAPDEPQDAAELRVGIYYRNNLIQSIVVGAQITKHGEEVTDWGNWAEPDFSLSGTLQTETLAALPNRRLSLWFNESAQGTHRLGIVSGQGEVALSRTVDFVEVQLQTAVREFRKRLSHVAFDLPPDVDDRNLPAELPYRFSPDDADGKKINEGTLPQLEHDLIRLAGVGYRLYDLLASTFTWEEQDALTDILRKPTVIQAVFTRSATLVFPWAAVYHHPFVPGDPKNRVCPEFLDVLQKGRDLLTDWTCLQGRCPNEEDVNVVCPSGFWGFKHIVETPLPYPGVDQNDVALVISVTGQVRLNLVESLDPAFVLRPVHEQRLRAWPNLEVVGPFTARLPALTAMQQEPPHIVYFYVDGGRSGTVPWLGIGQGERLQPTDLRALRVRWHVPRPLVFINGCHTVNLEPEAMLDFVRAFAGAHAAGVVGTEITLVEPFATWFAERFFSLFLAGQSIGEAMRRVRLDLLARYNPLGLVYTPYAYATLHLKESDGQTAPD